MQITRTSPSPPTLQRWGSVFITNGENGRMEKLTRVSEANRVSRVSRVSTFIYMHAYAHGGVYVLEFYLLYLLYLLGDRKENVLGHLLKGK